MSLKVAIISEKLGSSDASSSTVIADEAIFRGYKVYEFEAQNLRYSEGVLLAEASDYPSNAPKETNLEEMDVILFRPNPPVDMEYLTTLFLLRTIEDKVLIINRPTSVINFPEKIFPLYFKEHTPPTLISSSLNQIQKFAEKHGDLIIKPLYNYGGKGITKFDKNFSLKSELPIIAQKFISEVTQGDKRILFVCGEVVGVFNRIPLENSYLANQSQGGKVERSELTEIEKQICNKLTPILKENDIWICGIDVINNYITEINITSPTGFKWTHEFFGTHPEKKLWDIIESKLK